MKALAMISALILMAPNLLATEGGGTQCLPAGTPTSVTGPIAFVCPEGTTLKLEIVKTENGNEGTVTIKKYCYQPLPTFNIDEQFGSFGGDTFASTDPCIIGE